MSQTDFRVALLDGGQPAPNGLSNPDGVQATKRFNVYRNNVAVSLTEALVSAFPVIHKLVGDEFFRAMAGVFLRAHPPTSPVMMHYGAQMPAFLEGFPPAATLPYLPDVARLEQAIRASYHAEDSTPIPGDALTQIAPDDLPALRMCFAPSVALIPSRYPLASLWHANTTGGDVAQGPQPALVTRPEFDPIVDALTPTQAAVLDALMLGVPLGEALQHGAADFGPLLSLLLARGALIELKD